MTKQLFVAVVLLLLTASTAIAQSGRIYLPFIVNNTGNQAAQNAEPVENEPIDTTSRPSEDLIAQLPICTDEMVAEANARESIPMTDPSDINNWLCTARTVESVPLVLGPEAFFPDGRLPSIEEDGVQPASAQQATWLYGFSAMSCPTCSTSSGLDQVGAMLNVRDATGFGSGRSWQNFHYHNKIVVGAANQTITCQNGQTSIPVIGIGPARGNMNGSNLPAQVIYWTYFQNYCYYHNTNYFLTDTNKFYFFRTGRVGSSLWAADFWNGTAWVNYVTHAVPFNYANYFNAGIGVWAQYADHQAGIDLPVNGTRHVHFRMDGTTTYSWYEPDMPAAFAGKSSTTYQAPLSTTGDMGGNRTAIDVYVP